MRQSKTTVFDPTKDGAKLDDVVKNIQDALTDVKPYIAAHGMLDFTSAKISMQTTTTKKTSGEVDVWVLTGDASYEMDNTREIDVTFKLDKAQVTAKAENATLKNELEKAIVSALQGLKSSYPDKDYPLKADEIDIQIGFTVTVDGSIKVGGTIGSVGASGTFEASKAVQNTVTIQYGGS